MCVCVCVCTSIHVLMNRLLLAVRTQSSSEVLRQRRKICLSVFLREVTTRFTLTNVIPSGTREGVTNPNHKIGAELITWEGSEKTPVTAKTNPCSQGVSVQEPCSRCYKLHLTPFQLE